MEVLNFQAFKKSVNSDLLSNVNEINRLSGTADEREQRLQKRRTFTPSDSFPLKYEQSGLFLLVCIGESSNIWP